MQQLHDVRSAAKLLAISEWTVRAYVRQGKLHPVRIGRLVRFEVSEIQAFVAAAKGRINTTQKSDVEGVQQ